MSVRAELWGLGVSGTLCWIGFVLTVVNSNPSLGTAPLASLFISLFIGLLSAVALLGYALRRNLSHNEAKYQIMRTSFRQGFLVSGTVIALLFLQAARLLSWWDILLLLAVVSLLELYIRSYART